jgi:hypothetical protein
VRFAAQGNYRTALRVAAVKPGLLELPMPSGPYLVALFSLTAASTSDAFSMRSVFTNSLHPIRNPVPNQGRLMMRDVSASYWFRVGDKVQVVQDVYKGNSNLNQRIGTVREAWEKCDIDPTCCCAEQVDTGMAVKVEFEVTTDSEEGGASMFHHFAEDELIKLTDDAVDAMPSNETGS